MKPFQSGFGQSGTWVQRLALPVGVLFLGAGCAAAPKHGPATPSPAAGPSPAETPLSPDAQRDVKYALSGRHQYAVYRRDSIAVQMPSGEFQVQNLGRTAFLTITLVPAGADARAVVTLDSIRPDPDLYIPATALDSAAGTQWTGRLLSSGRWADLMATQRSRLGDQVGSELQTLFPILPPGGVRLGAQWSDSSTRRLKIGTIEATEAGETRYGAVGSESYDGASSLRIEGARTATLTGAGDASGPALAGTATDSMTYHVGVDGRVLGGSGTETADLTLTVMSVGQAVPARQISHFHFDAIGR